MSFCRLGRIIRPEVFYKIDVLKCFVKLTGKCRTEVTFSIGLQARSTTLLQRDSSTGAKSLKAPIFCFEHLSYRSPKNHLKTTSYKK